MHGVMLPVMSSAHLLLEHCEVLLPKLAVAPLGGGSAFYHDSHPQFSITHRYLCSSPKMETNFFLLNLLGAILDV